MSKSLNKRNERIGMRKQNHDGEWMEIKEYFNAQNITIMFDDGSIIYHREYNDFVKGKIKHPEFFKRRIGEERIANNGIKMKIIEVFGRDNITIQFDDEFKTIVRNKWYRDFVKGEIKNPNYHVKTNMPLYEFVFEYYLKKYGFKKTKFRELDEFKDCQDKNIKKMEFDCYNNKFKIAIEFDGKIHKKEDKIIMDLKKNRLCKEHGITLIRLRHKCDSLHDSSIDFIFNNGRESIDCIHFDKIIKEIFQYINSITNLAIDTSFFIREDYEDIRKKYIEKYKENRIGQTKRMNNGLMATVTTYRNSSDIDIQYEDGIMVYHKKYAHFKKGQIGHPFVNTKKKYVVA